jgi:hypothetical protein
MGWGQDCIDPFSLFFLASLVFAILWTVSKNDIQGVFGVAGWWVAVATLLLGYVVAQPGSR